MRIEILKQRVGGRFNLFDIEFFDVPILRNDPFFTTLPYGCEKVRRTAGAKRITRDNKVKLAAADYILNLFIGSADRAGANAHADFAGG
jgi:hypothetical protein